ncbi:MAG: guanylate kinase [Flavobacteriales bacterium]|jgi:guanylate kinase|nr:guanylate kinase [Flavobacteriales bacterium]
MESLNHKAVIFSAPSGAGKTTIVHHLLKTFEALEFSISACSRPRRHNERKGKDYHFLSIEDFKAKIANDEFVEWEEVYKDNFYGTLKSEVERIWSEGKTVIFDVDVVGGLNLKKYFGDNALAIFVKPPSIAHLEKRLRTRETETEASIARRIGKAEQELKTAHSFDYVLLNDNLEVAFAEAEKVLTSFLEK